MFAGQEAATGVRATADARGVELAPSVVGVDGPVPARDEGPGTLDLPVPDIPVSSIRFTKAA